MNERTKETGHKWTEEQEQCITARGGSLLVSAAAGAGKTAVLIERIIRLLDDTVHPVDVNRILAVTFTEDAAAQLREKLDRVLTEKAAENSDEHYYEKQRLLLPQADICTIDSFCHKLLRAYGGSIGISSSFRTLDEAEEKLLREEALDAVMEAQYKLHDPAFSALSDLLNGAKSDSGVRDTVENVYLYMQAQAFPERWLAAQADTYTDVVPVEAFTWFSALRRRLAGEVEQCRKTAEQIADMVREYGPEPFREAAVETVRLLREMARALPDTPVSGLHGLLSAELPEYPAVKGIRSIPRAEDAKKRHKRLASRLKTVAESVDFTEAELLEEQFAAVPLMDALQRLVMDFSAKFNELKAQKNACTFSDVEHACIRLLLDPDTGKPTPLGREIAERYDHILLDEYQDTNAAQDALFRAISRDENNLFLVGDIKQSIYRFRLAMPSIFVEHREAAAPYDGNAPVYPARIMLGHNFRSRREVTDGVNFVFSQLMHKDLGGVEYTEGEQLVAAADYPTAVSDHRTEWDIIDQSGSADDCAVAEARLIARRIREMMAQIPAVHTKNGDRPPRYGDFCVLTRRWKNTGVFRRELEAAGLPVSMGNDDDILREPEVQTVLALLRIIDNPLREVELTAVMLSPLYGFTPDDCARIRLSAPKEPLYTAIEAVGDSDDTAAPLCRAFIADLRQARALAIHLPADRLLERLYRDMGLIALFSAQPGGSQKAAHLQQLDRVARRYEQGEFRGLSAFVRYIDRLEQNGRALTADSDRHDDAVKITSIHKSKGLEYPFVFLAELTRPLRGDNTRSCVYHDTYGIAFKRRIGGILFPTHAQQEIEDVCKREGRAEELRLLYVAMTRAREKLCLVFSVSDLDKKIKKLSPDVPSSGPLSSDVLLSYGNMGDWLLLAGARHPDLAHLWGKEADILPSDASFTLRITEPDALPAPEEEFAGAKWPSADTALVSALRERAEWPYPYAALSAVPAKLAASALSHEAMQKDRIATSRPGFMQKGGLTPAEKGTALHTFMQFADFARAEADPAGEIARLTEKGFLTSAQAAVLPIGKINGFFRSPLYARMNTAAELFREYPFTVEAPADTVCPEAAGHTDEKVILQGIADAVFREGDGLVLVDYKTDRVETPEELTDLYRSQLTFYRRALETIFGLPVKEAYLYSFALETAVAVSL